MIDKGCTVYPMNASLLTERGVLHLFTEKPTADEGIALERSRTIRPVREAPHMRRQEKAGSQ